MTTLRKVLLKITVLCGIIFLNGCVFYDYSEPHIDGVLSDKGRPLYGVRVSLLHFGEKIKTTTTDRKGYFSLIPEGSWNFLIPIGPVDRITDWSVIIEKQPVDILGYRMGGINSPLYAYSRYDRAILICDISLVKNESENSEENPVCEYYSNKK